MNYFNRKEDYFMKKNFSFFVEIPLESLEDFSKGNVSRGAIHLGEDGHPKFVRYHLGEGRKLGPRKPFNLPPSGGDAAVADFIDKKGLTCRKVTDELGQITGLLIEPEPSLPARDKVFELIARLFNFKNKGGENANN